MDSERLAKQFNLSPDDASAVFCIQHGLCPICKRELDPAKASTVGDHEHETGVFRGWLCWLCNRGLGLLGDDIARLEAAVAYLKEPPALLVLGRRYGTIGRKAGSVPRNRRAGFYPRSAAVLGGREYRCGCRDLNERPLKLCPIHKQPER